MATKISTGEVLIGALLGGLLLGGATALLSTKKGKKIKNQVGEKLHDLKENVEGFMDNFSEKSHEARKQAHDWSTKAQYVLDAINQINNTEPERHSKSGLLLGGILGALAGAAAGTLLAPRLEFEEGEYFSNIRRNWKPMASKIIELINEKATNHFETPEDDEEESTLNEALQFASAGFRLWKSIKH